MLFYTLKILGLRNLDSRQSHKAECELCFSAISVVRHPKETVLSPNKDPLIVIASGNFAVALECWYKPRINSRCPKVVRNAKTVFRNLAIRNGERLVQYSNTPTCDSSNDFHQRYQSRIFL